MLNFYGEELLAPRPTPKLDYHPLSSVHNCLFISGGRLLYPQPEDASCRGDRDPHIAERDLLEKLTVSQLVKKFYALYVNRRFITVFTKSRKYYYHSALLI
jgi:hypothetical protein